MKINDNGRPVDPTPDGTLAAPSPVEAAFRSRPKTLVTFVVAFDGNGPRISLNSSVDVDGCSGNLEGITFCDLQSVEEILTRNLQSIADGIGMPDFVAQRALEKANEVRVANHRGRSVDGAATAPPIAPDPAGRPSLPTP